jgi:hypothetical protein
VREAEPVAVQEDHPRVDAHSSLAGSRAQIAERIDRPGQLGDAWLELKTLIPRLIGSEKDGTTLQVTDLVYGIVGKEVPGVMIGNSQRQPVYPRPLLDVAQDRV